MKVGQWIPPATISHVLLHGGRLPPNVMGYLAREIRRNHTFDPRALALSLHSIAHLKNHQGPAPVVKSLVEKLRRVGPEWRLDPQGVAQSMAGISGARRIGVERDFLRILTPIVGRCREPFPSGVVAAALYSLRESTQSLESRSLLLTLVPFIVHSCSDFGAKEVGACLYGLS
eukprot:Hpha_TRINITY_DN5884_c0_g1::TRINITY_DN5884_c0_g1_i1::g.45634::m.45634